GLRGLLAAEAKPPPRREHRAAGEHVWSEAHHPDGFLHVWVDGFHPTSHEVGLVPEACASGVGQEALPPYVVRFRAGPAFERVEVTPVLPHAAVRREQREYEVL